MQHISNPHPAPHFDISTIFKRSPERERWAMKMLRLNWTTRLSRRKEIHEWKKGKGGAFMSLIQVVQGHRAQCTLVGRSPRIHGSFLFPDMVHAALPQGV